jgi:serine protein kinase
VYIVKVPYCLRISEEIKIYEKLLNHSELVHAPCAPGTLETLSRFSILAPERTGKLQHLLENACL